MKSTRRKSGMVHEGSDMKRYTRRKSDMKSTRRKSDMKMKEEL